MADPFADIPTIRGQAGKAEVKTPAAGIPAVATTFGYNDPEDNGIGAWGDVTNSPDVHGVSLPLDVLRQQFGDPDKAHGQLVRVTNPQTGKSVVAPILDKGPASWVVARQGNTIDLTHATNQAIGGTGKTPVQYSFEGVSDPFEDIPAVGQPAQNGAIATRPAISTSDDPYANIPLLSEEELSQTQAPWYKKLAGSLAAESAAGLIRQAGGLGPMLTPPLPKETQEAAPILPVDTSEIQNQIADKQAAIDQIKGIVKKQGFSTPEYDNTITNLQQEIQGLQSQAGQVSPESIQGTQQLRQERVKRMGEYEKTAESMYPTMGVSPTDTSISAQIGRGIGDIASLAPSMLLGLPGMAVAGAGEAYTEKYKQKADELKQQGVTDQQKIDDEAHRAGSVAAVETLPQLGVYMLGGKLVSKATSALMKEASPLAKAFAGGAAAAGVNMLTSAGLRAASGQSITPTIQGSVQDILFGGFHGGGAGLEARAEQRKAREAEGQPAPELAPSANPQVNEKQAQIDAGANSQFIPAPDVNIATEAPAPKTEVAPAPTADLSDLYLQQMEHEPGTPEHTAIQEQIDAAKRGEPPPKEEPSAAEQAPTAEPTAEAPAEAQPTQPNESFQIEKTGEVGVRNAPAVGEGVGEENKPEVAPEQGEAPKEEVKPTTPTIETTGEGQLFGEDALPFNLAGETMAPEPERATVGTDVEQPLPMGEAPATAPEAPKKSAPIRDILYRFQNGEEDGINTLQELHDAIRDAARKLRNRNLRETAAEIQEAIDYGVDVNEGKDLVERSLATLEREANYLDKPPEKEQSFTYKSRGGRKKYFGFEGDDVMRHVLDHKILDPEEWKRRFKTGQYEGAKGGEYDPYFEGHVDIPDYYYDKIFAKKGKTRGINEVAADIGMSADQLWSYIDQAIKDAKSRRVQEEAYNKSLQEHLDALKAAEKLKKENPEAYAGAVESQVRDYLIKRLRNEGGYTELPRIVYDALVSVGNSIRKAGQSFADWSKEMVSRLGDGVKGYLRQAWDAYKKSRFGRETGAIDIGQGGRPERFSPEEAKRRAAVKRLYDIVSQNEGKPGFEKFSDLLARKYPDLKNDPASLRELYSMASGERGGFTYPSKEAAPAAAAATTPAASPTGGAAKFGISRAAQEGMVEQGLMREPSPSIEPMSQEDQLARASEALRNGSDPEQVIADLRLANISEKIAEGYLHAQRLGQVAAEALSKYGPDSPQYKNAMEMHQDYQNRLKEAGASQAGRGLNLVGRQTNLDDANLTDAYEFQNNFSQTTGGRDLTRTQLDEAAKLARKNREANERVRKQQEEVSKLRDEGFSDVDVKTPETIDEGVKQVADLSDQEGRTQRVEIDRLNGELEQTKSDLEELRQAKSTGQDAASLREYYEAKVRDLQSQLEQRPKYGKEVFEQARKIVDRWKAEAVEAEKELRKILAQQGTSPDPSAILPLAKIIKAWVGERGLDFAQASTELIAKFGEKIRPHLKAAWDKAQELIKGEPGGEKAARTVSSSKGKAKAKPEAKMTPAEKAEESLRKRISQAQKKIDDINSGKVKTAKDVEKVTNEEIQRLEQEYSQKKQELANARLKAKVAETIPKKLTGSLNGEQARTLWETAKKFYIPKMDKDPFYDEHKLVSDMADDFGLTPEQVRGAFAMPKGAAKAAKNMYAEQIRRQNVLNNSRRWLINQKANWIQKATGCASDVAFAIATFGHGTAFVGTHAVPVMLTHPIVGIKSFLKGLRYTFTGKDGRVRNAIDMHDITNHPDFPIAIKGGLDVNPFAYGTERPQRSNPDSRIAKILDPLTGGRGFDALYWMRMKLFEKYWGSLSPKYQTDEMAKLLSSKINNMTGYANSELGSKPWVRLALFAPKLIKAQFNWLIGDPARMLGTFGKMAIGKEATPEQYMNARIEAVQKAKFLTAAVGLLGFNQVLLSLTGSDQKINFTDFKKPDWLAFKGFGYEVRPFRAYTSIVRLVGKTLHDLLGERFPKTFGALTPLEKSTGNNMKRAAIDAVDYLYGKLSPLARDVAVIANQQDFAGNTVPWSNKPPLRGREKLSWPQFITEMVSPIPVSEAASEKKFVPSIVRGVTGGGMPSVEEVGPGLIKGAFGGVFGVPAETPEGIRERERSYQSKGRKSSMGINLPKLPKMPSF